eukprot:91592-Chlamydomonas_euryale.AAC.6
MHKQSRIAVRIAVPRGRGPVVARADGFGAHRPKAGAAFAEVAKSRCRSLAVGAGSCSPGVITT